MFHEISLLSTDTIIVGLLMPFLLGIFAGIYILQHMMDNRHRIQQEPIDNTPVSRPKLPKSSKFSKARRTYSEQERSVFRVIAGRRKQQISR